jgi:hypothetical protein
MVTSDPRDTIIDLLTHDNTAPPPRPQSSATMEVRSKLRRIRIRMPQATAISSFGIPNPAEVKRLHGGSPESFAIDLTTKSLQTVP